MDAVEHYLSLPDADQGWLHWSLAGDALQRPDGSTFALSPQVALFLEGYCGLARAGGSGDVLDGRRVVLPAIDYLLYLMGHFCTATASHAAQRLRGAFLRNGKSLGNAGALCAYLARTLPTGGSPLDVAHLCGTLWSPLLMGELAQRWRDGTAPRCPPTLEPEYLDRQREQLQPFFARLNELTDEDLDHWLKHGCSPLGDDVERLAEPLPARHMPTLGEILADLQVRPRLAGAVPFVAQMVSALTLPPRRVKQSELPIGGYADVINRGQPEQLLPSQFAIDDDLEFIRRFAENELLYFRREEPSVQIREELIVLVDQGARTWGVVRLALVAAVFALIQRAGKRKLPVRLAATSNGGKLLAPLEIDPETLGKLLDASDLTFDPGLALETVLDVPSARPRDIVLLTHPRNLDEEDVRVAARKVTGDTRLFALAVDDQGAARLDEFRRGTPMPLRQFRVDLTLPELEDEPTIVASSDWAGDVEPVGFPFHFGISGKLNHVDFTSDESWLLAGTSTGMLFAYATDGSRLEILPRPMHMGQLLTSIDAVLGVAGGFALCGHLNDLVVVAHYDLHTRQVRLHVLDSIKNVRKNWRWCYYHEYHVVVADCHDMTRAVDLSTNQLAFQIPKLQNIYQPPRADTAPRTDAWGNARLRAACEQANASVLVPPWLPVFTAGPVGQYRHPYVRLDPVLGTLSVSKEDARAAGDLWQFTPLADGQPVLRGMSILRACLRGGVLAAEFNGPNLGLRLYGVQRGTPLAVLVRSESFADCFMLSPSGRFLAYQHKNDIMLRRIAMAKEVGLPRGRTHNQLHLELGDHDLIVGLRRWQHHLSWAKGRLEHQRGQFPGQRVAARPDTLPAWTRYDPRRFLAGAQCGALSAVVDHFGQVTVCDRSGHVICMFFVFRNHLAAWMPDGTRYGPVAVSGASATAGALDKIGQALQAATTSAAPARPPVARQRGAR